MQNKQDKFNWFEDWFNSPYYHLLYKDRNHIEAEHFICNILSYLAPEKFSKMLDVACGKGRHSLFISKQGYTTDGFDLSENSINEAKKHENQHLKFHVNDIRIPLKTNYYHFAFNLFTSFGYFINEEDNQKAIDAISTSLVKDGVLVIDFMNVNYTLGNLTHSEVKQIEGITFKIKKEIEHDFIVKHIEFDDKNNHYHFTERVKILHLNDFINYFTQANLKIETTFGDYSLNPFDENTSERLIIIAKK